MSWITSRPARQESPKGATGRRSPKPRSAPERSIRYLVQLCEHISHTAQPHDVHVDWSDDCGTATFARGSCTLRADPGSLFLRAEATDAQTLHRVTDILGTLLERIGRRDHLTVIWTPIQDTGNQP